MSQAAKSIVRDSKLLSLVLRHAPEKAGLTLSDGGWVGVQELLSGLSKMNRTISLERLRHIVETNEKKRFTLSDDGRQIRAAQGHSVKIKTDYHPVSPPQQLYHGTATRFIDAIKTSGLKPMSRQHVHLSLDLETAKKVGQRHGKPVILNINSAAMAKDGHEFYVADNGVWLTDHVPTRYIDWEKYS